MLLQSGRNSSKRPALVAPALLTESDNREVTSIERELMVFLKLILQWAQVIDGDLRDRRTQFTDKVLMILVGQVVNGPAMAEVNVIDNPGFLQEAEGAIDR